MVERCRKLVAGQERACEADTHRLNTPASTVRHALAGRAGENRHTKALPSLNCSALVSGVIHGYLQHITFGHQGMLSYYDRYTQLVSQVSSGVRMYSSTLYR